MKTFRLTIGLLCVWFTVCDDKDKAIKDVRLCWDLVYCHIVCKNLYSKMKKTKKCNL